MNLPYLTGELRSLFDEWLESTLGRYLPPLNFTELRKGVQAISSLYVERRLEGRIAARAVEGVGKRAALATYYSALHFLTIHHAIRMLGKETFNDVNRVVDLGCGCGASGAAAATLIPGPPVMLGIDRSGWALEEVPRTWGAFGLTGRWIRGEAPLAAPRPVAGDLVVFGWCLSEMDEADRAASFKYLAGALRKGSALLIAEPLAGRILPWWKDWQEELALEGIRGEVIRVAIDRPLFIQDMDKASGLDHQVLGCRILAGRMRTPAKKPPLS